MVKISNSKDLINALDNKYNNGYPTFFKTINGLAISFDIVEDNKELYLNALNNKDFANGMDLIYTHEVNWESNIVCHISGIRIAKACE